MTSDDMIKDAREAFELAREHEAENRRDALDDLRFARMGEQWPAAVRRDRELDGRPCLTSRVRFERSLASDEWGLPWPACSRCDPVSRPGRAAPAAGASPSKAGPVGGGSFALRRAA